MKSCIRPEMSFENRMRCLRDLKDIGYPGRLRLYGRLAVPDIRNAR